MSEFLSSPWVPEFILILLSGSARAIRRSWLSPSALVGLIWAFYVGCCLVLTDYKIYSGGVWIIVLFVFSVQFGSVLAEGNGRALLSVTDGSDIPQAWSNRSFVFTIIFTTVAMIGTVHLLRYSLDKYSLGFSFVDLLRLGHLWSVARYSSGEVEPWSVRLLIMWVYPAALLGGICFASAQRSLQKYISFMPFVPAALIGSLFAARAGLAFSVVCWLSAVLATRYFGSRGTYPLFQKRIVISMLALVACGLLFFVAIDTLRIFEAGDNTELRLDASRISKYFFGSVPALCHWFHYMHNEQPTWGAFTFPGVFDLLGIKERRIGVYSDYLTLAGGEEINIYTMLRGLVEDFTPAGVCVFGVLLGLVTGVASRLGYMVRILVMAGYYALLFFSPLISLFAYNGLILAWVVAGLILGWRSRSQTVESHSTMAA